MNIDKLVEFFQKNGNAYGWMSPTGDVFFGADMYEHFTLLKNDPYFEKLIQLSAHYRDLASQDEQDFIDALDPDEHPGWHNFSTRWSSLGDMTRSLILARAYERGWLRFALFKRGISSIEGYGNIVNRYTRDISDLELLLGIKILKESADQTMSGDLSYLRNAFFCLDNSSKVKHNMSKDFVKNRENSIAEWKEVGLYDFLVELYKDNSVARETLSKL